MHRRCLAIVGAVAAVVVLVSLAPVGVAGQASSTSNAAKKWTAPRTPWGHPDLQGIWANKSTTPLERPNKYLGREFLTDQELADAEKRDLARRYDMDRREQKPGSVSDVGRAYNAVWYDRTGHPSRRTSLITEPADGQMPPLTPQARERFAAFAKVKGLFNSAASPEGSLWNGGRNGGDEEPEDGTEGGVDGRGSRADNPEDRRLSERCILWAPLPRVPGGYNSNMQIVQTPDHVMIQMEMIHDARVIPLDGRPHLPQGVRQWFGDSRGRWEGDTLVIDTTNFTNKAPFKGSFDGLHIVERLKRVDANTVDYQVNIEDPTTWTRPWAATWPLTALTEGEDLVTVASMFEFACHEGNYGLGGQLRGSRFQDGKLGAGSK